MRIADCNWKAWVDNNTVFRSLFILLTVAVWLGFSTGIFDTADEQKNVRIAQLHNRSLNIEACASGLEQRKRAGSVSYYSQLVDRVHVLDQQLSLNKAKLSSQFAKDWRPGQCWRFRARLRKPSSLSNPGGFDYVAWLARKGIDVMLKLDESVPAELVSNASGPFDKLRYRLAREISVIEHESSHFIAALLIAERSGFKHSDWRELKHSGLIHLFAISGLHVGMVSVSAYLLFRVLLIPLLGLFPVLSVRSWAMLLSLLPAGAYVLMAGASTPTLRSFFMLCCVVLVLLWRRKSPPLRVLFLVALLLWLYHPANLFDASYQLSFAAVFAVLLYQKTVNKQISAVSRLFILQIYLLVILAPFLVYWAQGISLSAVLLNIIVIPVFAFIVMPLLFLSLLCHMLFAQPVFLSPSNVLLLQAETNNLHQSIWLFLAELIQNFMWVLQDSSWIEGSFIRFSHHPMPLSLLTLAMLLFITYAFRKKIKFALLVLVLFFVAWLLPLQHIKHGEFLLSVLDVGQGSAAVLETQQQVWIFDLGPSWSSGTDAGEQVVAPWLLWRGHRHVDMVMLSHLDDDHAGGMPGFSRTHPVNRVLAPSRRRVLAPHLLAAASNVARFAAISGYCHAGQRWQFDGVQLEVLHPGRGSVYAGNNSSCVLKVSAKGFSVLLPGDIEKQVEFPLAANSAAKLEADVLLSPHHGSKSSSTWAFLSAVEPDWIVISSGRDNRFNHPHAVIRQRYQTLGIKTFNTAEHGAIFIDSAQKQVLPWRER